MPYRTSDGRLGCSMRLDSDHEAVCIAASLMHSAFEPYNVRSPESSGKREFTRCPSSLFLVAEVLTAVMKLLLLIDRDGAPALPSLP